MVLRWRASRARAPLKIAIHRAPRFLFLSPSFPATQRGLCGRESCRAARVIYKLPRDLPSVHVEKSVKSDSLKWRIQGRGPGTRVPPSPPSPLLSRSESGTALFDMYRAKIATLIYKLFNRITPSCLEHVIVGRGERTSTTCVITIA